MRPASSNKTSRARFGLWRGWWWSFTGLFTYSVVLPVSCLCAVGRGAAYLPMFVFVCGHWAGLELSCWRLSHCTKAVLFDGSRKHWTKITCWTTALCYVSWPDFYPEWDHLAVTTFLFLLFVHCSCRNTTILYSPTVVFRFFAVIEELH